MRTTARCPVNSSLKAAIFDVDGVLVASPHERAWREALEGFADPAKFTTEFYQAHVAGKPRLDGARATLEQLRVPDADSRITAYADKKQALIDKLIAAGSFEAFPDAVRFAVALDAAGFKLALASSSKNAGAMLSRLKTPDGDTLLSIFDADLCGADVPRGKPDPAIFLLAAKALGVSPDHCVVIEDAPAGVRAAKAGGMEAIGIARLGDEELLRAAKADLVVTSLDRVDVPALALGQMRPRAVKELAAMHPALEATGDPDWVISHEGYSVLTESSFESRFAIGNGFLGMRAARSASRGPTWVSWLGYSRWASWPRCYVAGLFDTPNTEPPVPALVPVADWSRLRIFLNGEPLLAREGELLYGVRKLDMRRAALLSEWTHRTPAGITFMGRELRMVSQADRACGLQLFQFAVDREDVEITVDVSFAMAGLGMEPTHLEQDLGVWRTEGLGKSVAMAGAATLTIEGQPRAPERPFPLRWVWTWRSTAGQFAKFGRIVAVARADAGEEDPSADAREALAHATSIGWPAVLAAHEEAWNKRWAVSDIVIDGDEKSQKVVRFAIYHLTSAANPDDEEVSVGARALTGDAYLGHVFWDTEIYLLPFYIASWPEAARALLMYRFHTLPAAREKAAHAGYRGALYAWESADTGSETTPEHVLADDGTQIEILSGRLEQHISADVAYAVWQYWRATGDDGFFLAAGAEILLETARFWASRAAREHDGKRHIRHVIGPDEYHEDVDDNAFTNLMARWNIARGLEVLDLLATRWFEHFARLRNQLALSDTEVAEWHDVVNRLVTGLDPATGLYEQFAGFYGLEPIKLSDYADRKVPMDVVLGRERTKHAQVVKQADVVALIALLPEEFSGTRAEVNFRYYEPRCSHGSSLSPAMHALVAARIGDTDMALRYLHAIADTDPDPNSAGGVRIAGLGGVWQSVVMGFGGLTLGGDMLGIDPRLPKQWRSLSFRTHWQGRTVAFHVGDGHVQATLVSGEPLPVRIADTVHTLTRTPLNVALEDSREQRPEPQAERAAPLH
jgi:trehalose/maltose hydrolase-like predicted phosphorylase/beta-phosphoglucomutase-like phosphatase (HAD superfamily)